jgi:release factor glutamine methyltransferase
MTIEEALRWGRRRLATSPTPHQDARLLLRGVLGVDHAYLAGHPEQLLTADQEEKFRALVARAVEGEPIPYILGEADFYGLRFKVTPAVLIPRPETELLLEAALEWAKSHDAQRIVDVGTGSGCIAITLAQHLPQVRIAATDVSPEALAIARQNASRHQVADRIDFFQGSLLQPVVESIDLLVANLPYVSDEEWTSLDDTIKWYEPAGALRGGPDGLHLIRRLLRQARTRLTRGGAIFLEIGWRQGRAAQELARSIFPTAHTSVRLDYAGHDRLIIIETDEE